MTMARVGTVLGTMEFGRGPCTAAVAQQMVDLFLSKAGPGCEPVPHLDTAYMYAGGATETILGELSGWQGGKASMDTKINPWDKKDFSAACVRQQVETCLGRLQVPSVEVLYLHGPDHKTPLRETLGTLDLLHKEGKFRQLGLSNYSSWLVAEVVRECRANGWVTPTVYQGMYSAVTRQVEEELLPCLRYYNIAFYAYSPLGGGVLTGKYKFQQQEEKSIEIGRFNGVGWDKVYRDRYWKQEHFDAIENLKVLLKEHYPDECVSVAEAAFRWIYNHSKLDASKGDAVILGSSRIEQLQQNLDLVSKGPLAQPIVDFFEDWWKCTKHLCPNYFR